MKLGLTGGIGCGKSTVLKIFEENGASVIDCDKVVGDLFRCDGKLLEELRVCFGDEVLGEDGSVNRKGLADLVFSDPEQRRILEGIVHPRVNSYWQSRLLEEPKRLWVVEIPLLFEKKLEKRFDFTVCVWSSLTIQKLRLQNRGLSSEQIEKRLASQLPLLEKVHRADFVISNTTSLAFLRRQVLLLLRKINIAK